MSAEKQKTILLVEDEAITAMAAKMILEKYGYEVLTANTGEEAVATVEKTPAIDLILMDINLGAGIDGTEAAAIILRQRDLPVVFLSSHTEPGIVAKTEKITSYGYVVKNSGNTVLQASIKMAFKLFASHEEIRKNEERQQLILAALPIAIFTSPLDPEVDASWVSGDVEKVTGFTVEQYLAEKDFWRSRLHADDRERVLTAYKNPAAGDEIVLEYRWLCKDGNYKLFYDRSIKKRYPQGIQYVGIILDITERKRAESQREAALEDLRNSEEKFRGLTENINLGIYRNTVGPEGKFIEANPAIIVMFGYKSKEEFLAVNVSGLYQNPEDRKKFNDKMLKQGIVRGEELWLKRKDGSFFIGSVSAVAVKDEQGQVKYYDGIIDDITERKRAESQREAAREALRESEEWFRTLYENFTIGLYRTTPDGRIQLANPALVRMLGYSSFANLSARNLEKNGFDPSLPRTQFIEKIEKDGEVKGLESAWKRKDGTMIFVRESARAFRDSQGKTLYYDGTVEDITGRKQAEETLRQSEERYRALVENASDIVLRTDKNGCFTFVNLVGLRISGYEEWEVIGKHYSTLLHPDMRAQIIRHFGRQFIQGIQNTYSEYPLNTKDGHLVWIGQNTQLIVEDGQVMGFQAVARDITERRQAEEEIKRQLAEKEILLKEVHHRIKNNIASIGGLLTLQMQAITNPEAIAILKDANGRVSSMQILYDKLLLSEDHKDVSVKSYLDDLIDTIIAIFPDHAKITIKKRIADFYLDPRRLFPLGSIINELLTNTMKYAFTNRDTGLITIFLKNLKKHITLTVQDNGSGLPDGFDINESKGFGLMLVKMLSQQLAGNFSIKKHRGTRCMIEFDI